jgi:tRNA(adenine34) deaminase
LNHSDFMRQALVEAQQAAREDEVPVGAVLVAQDGTVLAKARNQTITLCDPTAHAEILALRAASRAIANYRLPNTTLYVTIEPCIMCMGALLHARVARIVFGAKDPKWGGAGSCYNLAADAGLNHTIDVQAGLLENECRELMQNFFRAKRLEGRRPYSG